MLKDDWVYAGHMLDMCQQALDITVGKDKETYDQDVTLRLALTHLVQMVGEAAQHTSKQFREDHPEIPWREVIGMRLRIVHDFLKVDEEVVSQVVQEDLPQLIAKLRSSIPSEYQ